MAGDMVRSLRGRKALRVYRTFCGVEEQGCHDSGQYAQGDIFPGEI